MSIHNLVKCGWMLLLVFVIGCGGIESEEEISTDPTDTDYLLDNNLHANVDNSEVRKNSASLQQYSGTQDVKYRYIGIDPNSIPYSINTIKEVIEMTKIRLSNPVAKPKKISYWAEIGKDTVSNTEDPDDKD